jgi:hypothetical protein
VSDTRAAGDEDRGDPAEVTTGSGAAAAGASSTGGTAARRARVEADRAGRSAANRRRPTAAPPPSSGAGSRADSGAARDSGASDGSAPTAGATATSSAAARRELDPDRLAALEEERDFLLASLDDLEREHAAGDVDDVDYAALKDDYTSRAAAVLRAIESRQDAARSARGPRRPQRAVLIGGVVVLFAIALGVFVAQASGSRAPGQGVSGDIRQSTRDQLLAAQQLMGQGQYAEAIKTYDAVLQTSPDSAEALAYKGWLLRLTALQATKANDRDQLMAQSIKALDQAVAADPNYPDARVFRAVLLGDLGRAKDALADLDQIKPGGVPVFMQSTVDTLRAQLSGQLSGGASGTSGTTVPAAATPGTTAGGA